MIRRTAATTTILLLAAAASYGGQTSAGVQAFALAPHPPKRSTFVSTTRRTLSSPYLVSSLPSSARGGIISSLTTPLYASADIDGREEGSSDDTASSTTTSTTPRRQRSKRKRKQEVVVDGDNIQPDAAAAAAVKRPPTTTTSTMRLQPREDAPVQLQVQNVRDAIGGGGAGGGRDTDTRTIEKEEGRPHMTTTTTVAKSVASTTASSASSSATSSSSSNIDASLEQLLEDARRMQQEADEEASSLESKGWLLDALGDEKGGGVRSVVGNGLSTLVTADFFLVCGFLVWFLLGIFCRAAFQDDTVQIAFNNNFEKLVQPALGVLMIASIASSFFKEEEGGEGDLQ